jgi:hypothetical protein
MNPGISEEVGKTTRTVIESMRDSPMMIALILLQAFTLGGIAYSINQRAAYMQEERRLFFESNKNFITALQNAFLSCQATDKK